jgi:hypothetical protein
MRISKLFVAGILSIGLLASCKNSEEVPPGSPAVFSISLKGSPLSRTSADVTGDEANINRITVGLFDAGGNKVTITDLSSGDANFTGGVAKVTGTTQVTQAIIAANAPAGAFSAVNQISDFRSVAANLDLTATPTASGTAGAKQYNTALPMVGEGGVTITGTNGSGTVHLTRLVSKIVLSSVKTAFSPTGAYPNATFTMTEVFMYHVPSVAQFNVTTPNVSGNLVQGQTGVGSPKAYLSSGTVSQAITTTDYTPNYTFFTFPNVDQSNRTELIIGGTFVKDPNGSTIDKTPVQVYYPIIINHATANTVFSGSSTTPAGTDGAIGANQSYTLAAVITSKGVIDVSGTIDQAAVSLTVDVSDWVVKLTQTNTF